MALTPFRWIALAAIGCMLAIVALVSVTETIQDPFAPWTRSADTTEARLSEAASRLNNAAQTLAARYRLLFTLDSMRRSAARVPARDSLRVFIDPSYTPEQRAMIDKKVRDARGARSGQASGVDVFILNDTARVIRGVHRYGVTADIRYEIPARPGDRCRVFVRTGPFAYPFRMAFTSDNTSQQLLGPCGYFSTFGEPGPLVRQWLISVGWQYTIDGSWSVAPVLQEVPEDPSIFKGPSPAIDQLSISSGGPACIKGELDFCERAAYANPYRRRLTPVGGATAGYNFGQRRFVAGGLGYRAGELLSDAVREMGRERFKAFWTSPDSVPAAFEKASGERWGVFIRRWMIARYGAIEPGPRMSAFPLLTSTILVLIALGCTMLMSVKRTYT